MHQSSNISIPYQFRNYLSPQELEFKQSFVNTVSPYFKSGDYALTVTYKSYHNYPSYFDSTHNIQPNSDLNYLKYCLDFKHYMNCINRTFLGAAKCKSQSLNAVFGIEQSTNEGTHFHIILEAPPTDLIPKNNHVRELTDLWVGMNRTGNAKGTCITQCFDSDGWLRYIFKEITKNNTPRYDSTYWRLTK